MHAMDYIEPATTGTLSPHVLPLADLQEMSEPSVPIDELYKCMVESNVPSMCVTH